MEVVKFFPARSTSLARLRRMNSPSSCRQNTLFLIASGLTSMFSSVNYNMCSTSYRLQSVFDVLLKLINQALHNCSSSEKSIRSVSQIYHRSHQRIKEYGQCGQIACWKDVRFFNHLLQKGICHLGKACKKSNNRATGLVQYEINIYRRTTNIVYNTHGEKFLPTY